jgi:hypothetical protein
MREAVAGTNGVPAEFRRSVPILPMFEVEKTKGFYLGFLGFSLTSEHAFVPGAPVYRQISRAGLVIHLGDHHGDGKPGTPVVAEMAGGEDFHREISAKGYQYMRPGVERTPSNADLMTVIDPFGHDFRFNKFVRTRQVAGAQRLSPPAPVDRPPAQKARSRGRS